MNDDALGHLREARAALLAEMDVEYISVKPRPLENTLIFVDTAILWRQQDLQLKAPAENQAQDAPTGGGPHAGHFIKKCRVCMTVISQCRCPGPKPIIMGVCDKCEPIDPARIR